VQVRSYAKINWALRITGRRADGYHDLETLFQTISLFDELTFRESKRLALVCDDPSIPTDETNLVVRAARALGSPPVSIELRKHIPAGGGLGGGSSNAAATLVALNAMFDLRRDDLPSIALSLGSDVPFFLVGGTAYATGRGEVLTPMPMPMSMPSREALPLLLVLPRERVATPEAFARVTHFSVPLGIDAYRDRANFTNDFEQPVFAMIPSLRELRQRLIDAGAEWARMSGSGSTLVGAFATSEERDAAAERFPDVRVERAEPVNPRL
jgi:4-diphosphocytidyl-2-C-methyl-D-erythritol kinase